jgi:UDP-glucose:(glucosyl)LPS alpha-1,3-glucosyltransferase
MFVMNIQPSLFSPISGKRPFHIAFGVDSHYFRFMGVTITSLLENNPDIDFVLHIFAFSITDFNRDRLHQLETQFGVRINAHIIDPSVFGEYAKFPSFAQYSAAIFTRLLIPAALQEITDRVLYLDSDILCVGSIRELGAMDISNDIVAVVHDGGPETVKRQCQQLNLREGKYFNSGVLYINIPQWVAHDITAATIRVVLESGQKFIFPDQDALNIVLDGRARYMDGKWNLQYNLNSFLNDGIFSMRPTRDAVLIHFTGRIKPWHDWSLHEARSLFIKYQSRSPWAGTPLDAPKNYKEMRMFAWLLRRKGRVLSSALWYVKYLFAKFSPKPAYKSI